MQPLFLSTAFWGCYLFSFYAQWRWSCDFLWLDFKAQANKNANYKLLFSVSVEGERQRGSIYHQFMWLNSGYGKIVWHLIFMFHCTKSLKKYSSGLKKWSAFYILMTNYLFIFLSFCDIHGLSKIIKPRLTFNNLLMTRICPTFRPWATSWEARHESDHLNAFVLVLCGCFEI